MSFPMLAMSVAPFLHHILGVVFFCAKPKVGRIYARRVITFMKNAQTFRDGSTEYHPRHSMGCRELSSRQHNMAVVKTLKCSHPNPAARSFFEEFKKSGFKSFYFVRVSFFASSVDIATGATSSGYVSIALIRHGFTAIFASFGRIFLHGKVLLSCVMPRAINVAPRFSLTGGL